MSNDANVMLGKIVKNGLESFSQAAEEINRIASSYRRVPESYFKNVLLPIIRRHVNRDPDVEIGLWLNVADGLNRPIEVVSDTDRNEVLFVVPPAFNDIPLSDRLPEGRFVTIEHLVMQQRDMIDNGDRRTALEIDKQLVDVLKPRPEDETKTAHILLLANIWKRYNLPLSEVLGNLASDASSNTDQSVEKQPVVGNSSDDDFESAEMEY